MLDRRTFHEFVFCVAFGPMLVLIGMGLDSTVGVDYARTASSPIIGGAVNLCILLNLVVGSGLALLGALKVTEWVYMPAQRRHHIRAKPVLTTTWLIALIETTILLTLVLMWMSSA